MYGTRSEHIADASISGGGSPATNAARNREDTPMATLGMHGPDSLSLTLRGPAEEIVLATVRRWPYWSQAIVERDPSDAARCLAVTLITQRLYEPTLRAILQRGFGLTFGAEGGDCEVVPPAEPKPRRGRRA